MTPIADAWRDWVKEYFNESHNTNPPWVLLADYHRPFKTYSEKLRYECLQAVFNGTKDRRLKRARIAQLSYWWQHVDDILLASPDDIAKKVKRWENKKIGQAALLEMIRDILVRYYDLVSSKLGLKLVKLLNIKTCPYCNRQFIYTFKGRAIERPELDHFFPKNKYPLFCLSFYNLIPACHSCNHVKSEEVIGVNPYKRAFYRPFIVADKDGNVLTKAEIYKLKEDEIRLQFEPGDHEAQINSDVLGLEDVYNQHTDYVKELVDKSMAYDNYARESLVTTFQGAGYHPQQVYDFVWGRHLMEAEYEDRPLSKLTKDILDMLEIKRDINPEETE